MILTRFWACNIECIRCSLAAISKVQDFALALVPAFEKGGTHRDISVTCMAKSEVFCLCHKQVNQKAATIGASDIYLIFPFWLLFLNGRFGRGFRIGHGKFLLYSTIEFHLMKILTAWKLASSEFAAKLRLCANYLEHANSILSCTYFCYFEELESSFDKLMIKIISRRSV